MNDNVKTTESTYYPVRLQCDMPGCNHYVVGQSKEHVKVKLKNHKKTNYCKGYKN